MIIKYSQFFLMVLLSIHGFAYSQPMQVPPNAEFVFGNKEIRFYLMCRTGTAATCPNKDYIGANYDGTFSGVFFGEGIGAKRGENGTLIVNVNCKNSTIKDQYESKFTTPAKTSIKEAMMKTICNY